MAAVPEPAEQRAEHHIRSKAMSHCVICRAQGVAMYQDLTDRFFASAGQWNFVRCARPQCGILWLDPMPLECDIWKAYRDYYTHDEGGGSAERSHGMVRAILQSIKRAYLAARLGYTDRKVNWREQIVSGLAYLDPTRRADTDFPLKYLPYKSGGRMLDLGCGSGDLLERMSSLGWRAEGVDFDSAAVEVARRRGLRVRTGSLHQQQFPDGTFEAVVMSHVIEHIHQPLQLLKEVRRILKRGRRLVIATPNAHSLGHRMLGSRWPFLDPPRHLQVFTPHALSTLAFAAGFEEVRVCTEIRTAAAMLPRIDGSPLLGRLLEYGENLALHLDRNMGEEIALVAIK